VSYCSLDGLGRWGVLLRRLPHRTLVSAILFLCTVRCVDIQDPYPAALPPNLHFIITPALDAIVDAAAADSIVLAFDQPMDRPSLRQVQRVSFLLPAALHDLNGTWNDAGTRVVFHLSDFPHQPGAKYEVRFEGLRSAGGELYNGGPLEVRFATSGVPDLFPMDPHPRVATRVYCRHENQPNAPCGDVVLHFEADGTDTVRMQSTCDGCAPRDDWFQRRNQDTEWLGWNDLNIDETIVARIRWPTPPVLMRANARRGDSWDAPAQTAANGTQLVRWHVAHAGFDSPSCVVSVPGGTVEIAYSGSTVLDLDYELQMPDGSRESHLERWWMAPGVGVVKRDIHRQSGDGSAAHMTDIFVPSLVNLGR
jgi:hypothetical protein